MSSVAAKNPAPAQFAVVSSIVD